MIKSILKVIIPLVSFFAITEAYAKDIRYVYCTAVFTSGDSNTAFSTSVKDTAVTYSPIFEVDIQKDKSASSVNFSNDFANTVLDDTSYGSYGYIAKRQSPYHTPQRGCAFEFKSLAEAKKRYDQTYMEQKKKGLCGSIGIHPWVPEGYQPLYPIRTTSIYPAKALTDTCAYNHSETPAYIQKLEQK